MQFVNEVSVQAPPDELFEFVSDVQKVAECLPGASIAGRDGDDWNGGMRIKVGPILANYRGTLRFLELDAENHRAAMQARAKEVNGQGSAEAKISTVIEPTSDGSLIRMTTELQIRGRVAQFGRGAMEKISKKMFAEFARNLEMTISEPEANAARRAIPETSSPNGEAAPSAFAAAQETEALDVVGMLGGDALQEALPMILVALVALAFGFLLGERRGAERSARA